MRHSHDDQMRAAGLEHKTPTPREVVSINRALISRAIAPRPSHLAWRAKTVGGVRGLLKMSRSLKL